MLISCNHSRRCYLVWVPSEQNGGRDPSLLPVSFALLIKDDAPGAGLLLGWKTLEKEPGGDRT